MDPGSGGGPSGPDSRTGGRHDGVIQFIDEGLHVTAKNRSGSAEKELKTTVRKLRAKLDRADARAERLKTKAAGLEETAAELEAHVKKLKKRLKKASRPAETDVATPGPALTTVDPSPADTSQPAVSPDASWTVVQLRAEARSRGLTGLSGKSKAQLLAALG